MNNYGVRKADYFIKFSKKIPQFFIIHQRSDFILHYSFFQVGLLLRAKFHFPYRPSSLGRAATWATRSRKAAQAAWQADWVPESNPPPKLVSLGGA